MVSETAAREINRATGIRARNPDIRAVIIDAEAINDIDVTGIDMLTELIAELVGQDIKLACARIHTSVSRCLELARLAEEIDVYPTVAAAVNAYRTG